MKIVVAPDSFKESMTSTEAAKAIRRGLLGRRRALRVVTVAVADGGEGLVEAYHASRGGRLVSLPATGPLGETVEAAFLLLDRRSTGSRPRAESESRGGRTAVIEMASSSGLALVPARERDPWRATTWGVGEQLAAAIRSGARRIILGVGGSATVDGGLGMAAALGVRLLSSRGRPVARGAQGLLELERIDRRSVREARKRIRGVAVEVACDVENPLLGRDGAAAVFARQKFARPGSVPQQEIRRLEAGLRRLARIVRRDLGKSIRRLSGGGAAGGLAAGLAAFLAARLRPGSELVLEDIGFAEVLRGADLVVTGEGRMDAQSRGGKAPFGVAREAKRHGIPAVALVGRKEEGARELVSSGLFRGIYPVGRKGVSGQQALARAPRELERLAREVAPELLARGESGRSAGSEF